MKTIFFLAWGVLMCTCTLAQTSTDAIKLPGVPMPAYWDGMPDAIEKRETGIAFTAGKETDLYCFVDGSFYVNKVPKLLFTPDSNFIFSARIKPNLKNLYDGGALLLYSDESNWAKLLFEQNNDGTLGLGASLVKDKRGDDSYHVSVPGNSVYVKVVRSGGIFCFYYSPSGKAWKLLRTFPYEKWASMRIGFYAQSPRGNGCTVEFLDIKYRGEKFKDFFTGE